jgi:hypothetical protein
MRNERGKLLEAFQRWLGAEFCQLFGSRREDTFDHRLRPANALKNTGKQGERTQVLLPNPGFGGSD